ncbi:UTP--glucose-1-phosphate uridylyltransferase [Wenxinia saemankumensis]|uniref:UTP--glucose-1-phosphate uridylyltransferase n=1 Tax=Wenxinia saemankumensis TaxID=1447782 RepID=A0A1M6FST8_9RHOB|nr:UTP--glucose-1-phosphate uridylyltransferase [Wenxinia saemankumensis]SHJ00723.1 UDP-glucose pyrophosphorylase [Wenxinia saemankumensis]
MPQRVTKAVFPVAGMGTRFLPATKSVPKEIMTLVDRPLIQYAIDEARAAGITEFIFVTSRGKSALEDYFDSAPELQSKLERDGKKDLLKVLETTNMADGAIAYIRQHRALGLGHAVHCAARLVGDEPFAVILPDDVIAADKPCLAQMVEAYEETGGCMVAAMEVPDDKISAYGVLDVEPEKGRLAGNKRLARVRGMVEKPPKGENPSNLAVIGRYILPGAVMRTLGDIDPSAGNEIQLTDAIARQIDTQSGVHSFTFEGDRYDCGSKSGFLEATVAFGLARPDLQAEFSAFVDGICAKRAAAKAG